MKTYLPINILIFSFTTVTIVFFSKLSYSQQREYYVEIAETHEILPTIKISDVIQDKHGFIWIPAGFGLSRYDGHEIKTYQLETKDTLGNKVIQPLDISSLAIAKNGDIWMCSMTGEFARFDRSRDKIIPVDMGNGKRWQNYKDIVLEEQKLDTLEVLHNTDSIIGNYLKDKTFVDSKYNIWMNLANNGFCRVALDTNSFDQEKIKVKDFQWYHHLSTDLPEYFRVFEFFEDKNGKIWIPSNMGLLELDANGKIREMHKLTNKRDSLFQNNFRFGNLFLGDTMLYLGTNAKGVVTFDVRTETIKNYSFIPSLKNEWDSEKENIYKIQNATDCSFYDKVSGKIWVNGVVFEPEKHYNFFFDIKTKKFERIKVVYENDEQVPNHLFGRKILQDESGNHWISKSMVNEPTGGTALLKMKRSNKPFDFITSKSSDNVNVLKGNAICTDSLGNLWTETENGMANIDLRNNKVTYYPYNGADYKTLYPGKPLQKDFWGIGDLKIDKNGKIWAGTNYGLFTVDPKTGQWGIDSVLYEYAKNEKNYLACRSISITDNGNLWLSYFRKIIFYNTKSKKITAYNYPGFRSDRGGIMVWKVLWESDERVWFGNFIGGILASFNPKEISNPLNPDISKFKLYNYAQANPMLIDIKQRLWARSYAGEGAVYVDLKTGEERKLTKNDGLCRNGTASMVEDNMGRIWIGTKAGLSCFDPKTEAFKNFYEKDGMVSHVLGEATVSKISGEIFFCTQKGILRFHPDTVLAQTSPPKISFTGFELFGEEVTIGTEDSPLESHISTTDKIELAHWQNDMAFRFVALHFADPKRNTYKVKLENYDNDWRDIGTERSATYTNLSPGSYTFRVKAANKDGVWNEEGIAVAVTILPPPWQTWWAYLSYFIAFVGLVYLSRKQIIARERLKGNLELERMEKKKMQEVDRVKGELFANISHEFRTPLTLIQGPSKQLLDDDIDKNTIKKSASMILRNTGRLLTMVNQVLDLSKLDKGGLRLEITEQDMVEFLKRSFAAFESLAEQRKISYMFHADTRSFPFYFDREKMVKVMVNLLGNAFKFTPDGGNINLVLDTQTDPGHIIIKVTDTGIGVPKDKLDKIFERFYQVDSTQTRKYEGTGIGLALVKELVEGQHGTIQVESQQGKGTAFTVSLLKGSAHFDEKDMVTKVVVGNTKVIEEKLTDVEAPVIDNGGNLEGLPTLLVVDDNPDMRAYVKESLSGHFNCLEAKDGLEAWEHLQENTPDLVVSDVMMPRMDGFELCQKIKTEEATSHIPVVLLTARTGESTKLEGLETGADDYVTKPFSPVELRARISNLIEQRERLRQAFKKATIIDPKKVTVTSADERFLQRTMDIVEAHKSEPDFGSDALIKEVGLSKSRLHAKLKALTGQSASEFIRDLRLGYAVQLLEQGYGNVAQIAFEAGFNSQSYFTKCFKEKYGTSPKNYIFQKEGDKS